MILFLWLLIEKFSRWKSGKELAQRITRKEIKKQETTSMKSIGCHYSLEINYDNVNFTSSQVSELFPAAIMSVVFVKSFKRWARTKHEVRAFLRGTLRCNECGTSCHNTTLWLPYRAVGTKIESGVNRTCLQEGKVVYCLIKSWSRKVGTFWDELDLWLLFSVEHLESLNTVTPTVAI